MMLVLQSGLDIPSRIDLLKYTTEQLNKPRTQRRPPLGGKWSPEEDEELKRIVSLKGAKNWKKVIL